MSCSPSVTISFFSLLLALVTQQAMPAESGDSPIPVIVKEFNHSVGGANVSATDQVIENEIYRLLELYEDARMAGMLEEADMLAKQIVEISIQSYGRDSHDTARALTNLATLQSENEQYVAAIQNLSAAIDIVERVENNLSMSLLYPLNEMGRLQMRAGQTDLAQETWSRAVHISHVNLGPHNFEQVETLQAIAGLLVASGKYRKARKLRRRIGELLSRETTPIKEHALQAGYE
ncbi:MAG: tetratricopeptide repeat protein [Woeseiaceae bacterium]